MAIYTIIPNRDDPNFCRGRIKGYFWSDGQSQSSTKWVFSHEAAKATEIMRCASILGWNDLVRSGNQVTIPKTRIGQTQDDIIESVTTLQVTQGALTEAQGFLCGDLEGEGQANGGIYDATIEFVPDAATHAQQIKALMQRLGSTTVTIKVSGTGIKETHEVSIGSSEFRVCQAPFWYTSWGRVPGGQVSQDQITQSDGGLLSGTNPDPPPPPPVSTNMKNPIFGLVDRDGPASNYRYRDFAASFGGIVLKTTWAELEPTEGVFNWEPIDDAITEATTYGLKLRVRIYMGTLVVNNAGQPGAPTWLRNRCGTVTVVDPNWSGAASGTPIPRFWRPEYMTAYGKLMQAMAARYDSNSVLAEMNCGIGSLIGAETMIQRYDNATALNNAGYPGWQQDVALQKQGIDIYGTYWRRTGMYFALNAFQRIGTSASTATSFEIADYGASVLGPLFRPANNSLNYDDALVNQRTSAYKEIYDRMETVWMPAGIPCQIQTDNPGNMADYGGTINGSVTKSAQIACSCELPVSYTQNTGMLDDWAALDWGAPYVPRTVEPDPPPDPDPLPDPAPKVRPLRLIHPDPTLPASPAVNYVSAATVFISWADLQPTQGGAVAFTGGLTAQINAVKAAGKKVRLRVLAGTNSPTWLKNLNGGPITVINAEASLAAGSQVSGTVPLWWLPAHTDAYRDLMTKLAPLVEADTAIAEVVMSNGQIFSGGYPFDRPADVTGWPATGNKDRIIAAGWTVEQDIDAIEAGIAIHDVAFRNTRTLLVLAPYGGYNLDSAVRFTDYTLPVAQLAQSTLGQRLILGTKGLRSNGTDISSHGATARGMYAWFASQTGTARTTETDTKAAIEAAGGTMDSTIRYAARSLLAEAVTPPTDFASESEPTIATYDAYFTISGGENPLPPPDQPPLENTLDVTYLNAVYRIGGGDLVLHTADLYALLLTGTSALTTDALDRTLETVSELLAITGVDEAVGSGYTRVQLANKGRVLDTTNMRVNFDCDDVSYAAINVGTVRAAVIYEEGADDTERQLVSIHTGNFPIDTTGGPLVIPIADFIRMK